MSLEIKLAYSNTNEIKELFSEYTETLITSDNNFAEYLQIQNFDDELKHLHIKYGLPKGRLYMALYNNELAGCIALRQMNKSYCEMKRLYVRPKFRGCKIGGKLVDEVINDAKNIGYNHMVLDTFPFLNDAIGMYKKLGFYEIPAYNDSPMKETVFLKLDL